MRKTWTQLFLRYLLIFRYSYKNLSIFRFSSIKDNVEFFLNWINWIIICDKTHILKVKNSRKFWEQSADNKIFSYKLEIFIFKITQIVWKEARAMENSDILETREKIWNYSLIFFWETDFFCILKVQRISQNFVFFLTNFGYFFGQFRINWSCWENRVKYIKWILKK